MLPMKPTCHYLLLGILGLSLPISTAITLTSIEPVYACRPARPPSSLEERIDRTPIVFQGLVTKVDGDTIEIEVAQYFKGDGPLTVSLKGFNTNSCSNFIQEPGEHYLFFAEQEESQPLTAVYDGAFGSVRPWNEETQKELRELGLLVD